MDAKMFLENFGVIAEAPNGIAKLRGRFILIWTFRSYTRGVKV